MGDALKTVNSTRVPVMMIYLPMKVSIPSRTVAEVIPGGSLQNQDPPFILAEAGAAEEIAVKRPGKYSVCVVNKE